MELIPIYDHVWSSDFSYLRVLTCANHQTARYLTKNPFERNLHITRLPIGEGIERSATGECVCPFRDLVVIVNNGNDNPDTWSNTNND